MSQIPECFEHMLAAWNERDVERVRGHLERALAPNVVFCDPQNLTTGLDEFEAMVREFRATLPEAVCARSSGVDSHHHLYRYHWTVSVGDEVLVPGFDVVAVNDDGKVERVDGFFGDVPAAE